MFKSQNYCLSELTKSQKYDFKSHNYEIKSQHDELKCPNYVGIETKLK